MMCLRSWFIYLRRLPIPYVTDLREVPNVGILNVRIQVQLLLLFVYYVIVICILVWRRTMNTSLRKSTITNSETTRAYYVYRSPNNHTMYKYIILHM